VTGGQLQRGQTGATQSFEFEGDIRYYWFDFEWHCQGQQSHLIF